MKFSIPIWISEDAKSSDEWQVVQMSFFDQKGKQFGQLFDIKFKIVPESYAFLN
jgi:hypothetical protein